MERRTPRSVEQLLEQRYLSDASDEGFQEVLDLKLSIEQVARGKQRNVILRILSLYIGHILADTAQLVPQEAQSLYEFLVAWIDQDLEKSIEAANMADK